MFVSIKVRLFKCVPFRDINSVLFISILPLCCRTGKKKEDGDIEWLVNNRDIKKENLG